MSDAEVTRARLAAMRQSHHASRPRERRICARQSLQSLEEAAQRHPGEAKQATLQREDSEGIFYTEQDVRQKYCTFSSTFCSPEECQHLIGLQDLQA